MTDNLYRVGDKFKIIETTNSEFLIDDIFRLQQIRPGHYPYVFRKKYGSTIHELETNDNLTSVSGIKLCPFKRNFSDGISTKDDLVLKGHYRAISPHLLHDMAMIFRQGIAKHGLDSHRNITAKHAGDIYDALMRHIEKVRLGEFFDLESKQPHFAHAACNLSILMNINAKYNAEDIIKSINGELHE
jgi:hypothetical protein